MILKEKLKYIIQEVYQPIQEVIEDKNSKKYFIYLILIYLIGYASILIADVYYADDVNRAIRGRSGWGDFNRHLSNIFAKFLHMGWKLSDISPLTQFIAIALLCVSSILLVKVINGSLRLVPIIASTCIGLFPYFLSNFSYKFDSPYMAFSMLSSIVPFLWYRGNRNYFVISSVLGILGTMLTYQAASGVYIIIFIALITKDFLQKEKTFKEVLMTTAVALLSYIVVLLIFRFLFMGGGTHGYLKTSIFPVSELFTGIYHNLKQYFLLMKHDLHGGFIGYASLFFCALYAVKLFLLSQQNTFKSIVIPFISLIFMTLFLWGGFIALTKALFQPRAFLGVGVFVAVLAIIEVKEANKYLQWANKLFVGIFVYSLMSFSNAYGNALNAQVEYEDFRFEIAAHDLSKFISTEEKTKELKLQFIGKRLNYSPVLLNASYHYPLMKRLMPSREAGQRRNLTMESLGMPIIRRGKANKSCPQEANKTTLYSTAFHDIAKATDSGCYYIIFK